MTGDDTLANGAHGRPKVTIAIPTYNRAAWIEGAVMAALAQTYPDVEVLVSDNASTDETPAALNRFNDPRLRILRQATNVGLVGNWNACLAEARGDYIALVPDDDRISSHFAERCSKLLAEKPDLPIVLTLTDFRSSYDGGRIFHAKANKTFSTGIWDGPALLAEFLEDRLSIQMCGVLIRVDLLRAAGGFRADAPFSTDVCAWAPIVLRGSAGLINESCATFNDHDGSYTNTLDVAARLDDDWKFVELLIESAEKHIADHHKRSALILSAKRYSGRRVLEILGTCRKEGASLRDVIALIWRWRWSLIHARVDSATRFARLLSVLVLPKPLTRRLRSLKQNCERELEWKF